MLISQQIRAEVTKCIETSNTKQTVIWDFFCLFSLNFSSMHIPHVGFQTTHPMQHLDTGRQSKVNLFKKKKSRIELKLKK